MVLFVVGGLSVYWFAGVPTEVADWVAGTLVRRCAGVWVVRLRAFPDRCVIMSQR